ncbi:hypothetical protein ACJX0J_020095, partial [Zea mays]
MVRLRKVNHDVAKDEIARLCSFLVNYVSNIMVRVEHDAYGLFFDFLLSNKKRPCAVVAHLTRAYLIHHGFVCCVIPNYVAEHYVLNNLYVILYHILVGIAHNHHMILFGLFCTCIT